VIITTFLLLSFAAALHGEPFPGSREWAGKATKTANFVATGKIISLTLENLNGTVEVVPGPSFNASAEVRVEATSDKEAQRLLDQTKVSFQNDDGELSITMEEPWGRMERRGKSWHVHTDRRDGDYSVHARYKISIPPTASLSLNVVNGDLSVKGMTGELALSSVNGRVTLDATSSRDVKLNTVNGNIDASFASLAKGADVNAATVNGNVVLRLPSKAGFKLNASTMSGDIVSTFALPVVPGQREIDAEIRRESDRLQREKDRLRKEIRDKRRIKVKSDEDRESIEIDLSAINEAMADAERSIAEMSRELAQSVVASINRSYEGTFGGGGAEIRCSNLNGKIVLLSEGTKEIDAKSIVAPRKVFSVGSENPRVFRRNSQWPRVVVAPVPPVPPVPAIPAVPGVPPVPPVPPHYEEEGSIVKGDVNGPFVVSIPTGDVRVGKVSGNVRISTHAGQIRVARAGAGADLTSSGGDIRVEDVVGNLHALTYGGDVLVGSVSGDAKLDTMGGDVILKSAGGTVSASTGGGDVRVLKVRGALKAETRGGGIVAEIVTSDPKGPSELFANGGDVTLSVPSNFKGDLDIRVSGVDADSDYIVSAFPDLTVVKRRDSQSAQGKLNGGGPRVTIRTTSGTVTIRKGPGA